MSIETITISGHVGTEPKRNNEKFTNLVSFTVAVSNRIKKAGSTEYTESTNWYKCNSWSDKRADFLMSAIKKGDKVVVIGKPSVSVYTAKDGEAKATIEINLEQVEVMKKKDDATNSYDAANSAKYSKQSQHVSEVELDDEIPF